MILRRLAELWYHRRIIKDLRDVNCGLRDSLSIVMAKLADSENKIQDLRHRERLYLRRLREISGSAQEVLDRDLLSGVSVPSVVCSSTCAYVVPEKVGVEIKCGGSSA